MRILGVIPARGGSKGVPRKNIKLLAGKPLLQYTAEAGLGSIRLARLILSTDDPEIAEIGRNCGLEIPFLRPPELALDTTPTLPVIQHALRWMIERGEAFDAICLLQPTSPFRSAVVIDSCIDLFERHHADSVVTMLPVPHIYNPHWVYFQDAKGCMHLSTGERDPLPRRQTLPPAFHREGSVYVSRSEVVLECNSLFGDKVLGYVIESHLSLNIDTPADWEKAELLMAEKRRES